jgi:1,4-alpha-glucan branching enzyme
MIRKRKSRGSNEVRVTFVLPGDHQHGEAALVGTFNGWSPVTHPFVRRSNGTYSVSVVLNAGERHLFRYYAEDGHWFNEPEADGYEPSGHGSDNCVLQL